MKNYKQLLFLKLLPGIGSSTINKTYVPLIQKEIGFDNLVREVFSRETRLSEKILKEKIAATEEKAEVICNNVDIKIITVFDSEYPAGFKELGDKKPPFFYVRGNAELLNISGIAVIGTRHPSALTKKNGLDVVKKIIAASNGKTIISGLALGCDKIGHNAALQTKTPTVAVLPSGFNKIAPAPHKKLAETIVNEGGCLLSEYEPDEIVTKFSYVQRDTLTAALSSGIFVLECGVESGTMHTVKAGDKLKRILAAWKPEVSKSEEDKSEETDGDFAGNMLMIEEYYACSLTSDEDIAGFIAAVDVPKVKEDEGKLDKSVQSTLPF